MAVTLPNGVVVPNADGGETISASGVAEMRTLGSSVDAALANRALVGHTHAWATITGRPSSFPPSAHEHPVSQVTGLQEALDDASVDADEALAAYLAAMNN